MKLYRFEDAIAFHDCTQSYLLQQEAQHYFLFSIITKLMKSPERYCESPYLAIVEDDGQIVAIASLPFPQWVVFLFPEYFMKLCVGEHFFAYRQEVRAKLQT